MSKFCSQQLPVCKVIPPSDYDSRKSAWLSSPLMGFLALWSISLRFQARLLSRWKHTLLLGIALMIGVIPSVWSEVIPEVIYNEKAPQCTKHKTQLVKLCTEVLDEKWQWTTYYHNDFDGIRHCLEGCSWSALGVPGDASYVSTPKVHSLWIDKCNSLGGNSDGSNPYYEESCKFSYPLEEEKKLEVIDPACSAETVCDGKFLQLKTTNGQQTETVVIRDNAQELLNAKVERSGVVADGVTQLLLRIKSEVPIIFTLNEAQETSTLSNCKWGRLMQRDGSQANCGSMTAMPEDVGGQKYVFAAYQSPLNFPLEASTGSMPAKVTIEARKKADDKPVDQKELQLEPPPVMLVHGVWDSAKAWNPIFVPVLKERGYLFYPVDHSSGTYPASGTFDPLSTDSVAIPQLIDNTQTAIKNLRTQGIAASQVDVVAHSMGGLITRATVKTQNYGYQYNRMDNYEKGDFHKIITIGTPHQGTRIADVLVGGKCKEKPFNCHCGWAVEVGSHVGGAVGSIASDDSDVGTVAGAVVGGVVGGVTCAILTCQPETLETAMAKFGHKIGPAVYGFQTGSTAIKNIGDTPVPSHAIVGIAPTGSFPPGISPTEMGFNLLLWLYGLQKNGLNNVDEILGGNENHDTIVPVQSQQGGLSGDAVSTFHNVDHLGEIGGLKIEIGGTVVEGSHPAIGFHAEAPKIAEKVVSLLRESPDSPAFGHFTALPQQAGNSDVPFTDGCPATKRSVRDNHVSNAIITFEPTPGTMVTPGQKVQIRFDVTGGDAQDGLILSIGSQLVGLEGTPPYVVDYTVPDYPEARINIYAQTVNGDLNTEAYAVESYLTVKLPDTGTTGTTTETAPVGSCGTTNETNYTVPLDRTGFYIIEATLPANQRPGIWSLLIDSMSKAPRSKTIGIPYAGGLHGGVVLREKGLSSSWIGFSLAWPESVKIKATDSLKNLSSFKLEVVKQTEKGWTSVYGPVEASSEQVHSTNRLDAGFYAVVVTSKPDSPQGQLGISIDGQSLWGAVTGGWIDRTGVNYSAFFVGEPKQTADLKLLFCGSYGEGGAGQPAVRMLYQKADGTREVYWDGK